MRVMPGNSTKHRKRRGHTWKAWSNAQQTEPTDCNVKNRHTPAVGRGARSDVINADEPHAEFWRTCGTQRALANSACIYIPYEIRNSLPRTQLRTYNQNKPNTPDCMEGRHLQRLTGRGCVGQRGRPAFRPHSRVRGASLLPGPGLSCRLGFFPR